MASTRYTKRLLAAGASVLVGLATMAMTASPASAGPLVECAGNQTSTYDPPLTPTPQLTEIHVQQDLSCPVGELSTVRVDERFELTTGCLLPGDPLPSASAYDYEWDGGEAHSEITYTLWTVARPPGLTIATSTGTVTEGQYEGATAVEILTLVNPSVLECLSGIDRQSGSVSLTITG